MISLSLSCFFFIISFRSAIKISILIFSSSYFIFIWLQMNKISFRTHTYTHALACNIYRIAKMIKSIFVSIFVIFNFWKFFDVFLLYFIFSNWNKIMAMKQNMMNKHSQQIYIYIYIYYILENMLNEIVFAI